MKNDREYRLKKPNKPVQTLKRYDCIPEPLKPEFDRLEAETKAFEAYVKNSQDIKEIFDRLENELKGMELK